MTKYTNLLTAVIFSTSANPGWAKNNLEGLRIPVVQAVESEGKKPGTIAPNEIPAAIAGNIRSIMEKTIRKGILKTGAVVFGMDKQGRTVNSRVTRYVHSFIEDTSLSSESQLEKTDLGVLDDEKIFLKQTVIRSQGPIGGIMEYALYYFLPSGQLESVGLQLQLKDVLLIFSCSYPAAPDESRAEFCKNLKDITPQLSPKKPLVYSIKEKLKNQLEEPRPGPKIPSSPTIKS
ncbi:MAG: hypothetical protein HY401_00425 [Elusimicrobia bacterium]|nr:hypothetical protein [Elusimicrobiota bacterium]